ncbi:hypothetical protein RA180_19985 [Aeromonas salmonicida]|uniref:hypothetical protein n=1 Tax=Aeromonas salmonicida TaxID=645 RepID=UPI0027969814|nr:hypothetical protein [Aeromonas salmonicida]MDQ1886277.1 hypothetical protein [Aeromonas salmonicida]
MIKKSSRLSRIAVATVSALTMWHGTVSAESVTSPLSTTLDSSIPAAVQPVAIAKKVIDVTPAWEGGGDFYYFWDDDSYSIFDSSTKTLSAPQSVFRLPGWPAAKKLMAIMPYVRQEPPFESFDLYLWGDGSYWLFNSSTKELQERYTAPPIAGWLNKKVAAVVDAWGVNDYRNVFWSDGSYSDYQVSTKKITESYPDTGKFRWPSGKKLAATAPSWSNTSHVFYFWGDGAYSIFDTGTKTFTAHKDDTSDLTGWPTTDTVLFDPAKHEVRDIRVNQHSAGNGAIFANGRMQHRVVVRVQVTDRDRKGVSVIDANGGRNQAGQIRDFVTLYLGYKPVDTGANLAIDDEGDFPHSDWKASRSDAGYDKYLNAYAHYAQQIDGSFVELGQDDDAAYPASDGWNTYIYWVSSKAQTGSDPERICVRAGSYGTAGTGYYDGCANGRDESAKVRALPPKRYKNSDYLLSERAEVGIGANVNLFSVELRDAQIREAKKAREPTTGASSDCVAMSNRNTSINQRLSMVPFRQENYNSLEVYNLVNDSTTEVITPAKLGPLATDKIYLMEVFGKLDSQHVGIWSNCTGHENKKMNITASGKISFLDSYGNDGVIMFTPSIGKFVLQ